MTEKTLQTSKKKFPNNKWSYRGYFIQKDSSKWVIVKGELTDENSEKVYVIKSDKTIKNICLKIDEILGDLPNINPRPKRKRKITEEIVNQTLANARKIAYEVRTELENILSEKTENLEKKNKGILAIPFGQGKNIGGNGFALTWNKKFDIFESVIKSIQEKNPNVELSTKEEENKTELIVLIKV